jgi:hypothetical protein
VDSESESVDSVRVGGLRVVRVNVMAVFESRMAPAPRPVLSPRRPVIRVAAYRDGRWLCTWIRLGRKALFGGEVATVPSLVWPYRPGQLEMQATFLLLASTALKPSRGDGVPTSRIGRVLPK